MILRIVWKSVRRCAIITQITMKPALKYGLIIAAWLLYFAIGLGSDSETEEAPVTSISYSQCMEEAVRL